MSAMDFRFSIHSNLHSLKSKVKKGDLGLGDSTWHLVGGQVAVQSESFNQGRVTLRLTDSCIKLRFKVIVYIQRRDLEVYTLQNLHAGHVVGLLSIRGGFAHALKRVHNDLSENIVYKVKSHANATNC